MAKPFTWKNEKRKLGELISWEHNPRQITTEQAKHLQESLDKFGLVYPPLISKDNDIYDGHQREKVMGMMEQYSADTLIDVRVSSRVLTDNERRELVIRLHENTGEWDLEQLANLYDVDELDEWGFEDMDLVDWGQDDISDDPGAEIDKAEELREKWNVESGQLWELGEHRVICGDCTDEAVVERLMGGKTIQLLWTDPPYGVDYVGKTKAALVIAGDALGDLGTKELLDDCFGNLNMIMVDGCPVYIAHPAVVLSLQFMLAFIGARWHLHENLIWVKDSMVLGHSDYHLKHEGIYYGWKGTHKFWYGGRDKVSVFEIDRPKRSEDHPIKKPVELVGSHINNSSKKDDIVSDPFLGSGTTLIACERLHRKCYGIEIEPKYIAVTLERWHQMTGQQPELIDG
jgi:DNA modification methylase